MSSQKEKKIGNHNQKENREDIYLDNLITKKKSTNIFIHILKNLVYILPIFFFCFCKKYVELTSFIYIHL